MTLILASANPVGVNVVGDRLVSQERSGAIAEFDSRANKNVVFVARDGVFAIGYSGPAYIGPNTTDEWIAKICRGESPESDAKHEYMISGVPIPRWLDIGSLCLRLRDGLNARPFGQRFDGMFEILVAGIHIHKRWRHPLVRDVSNDGGRTQFRITTMGGGRERWVPRALAGGHPTSFGRYVNGTLTGERRDRARSALVAAIGVRPGPEMISALDQQLRAAGVTDVEGILVDLIRSVAATSSDVVGRDCMAIYLPARRLSIRVRYLPTDHRPELVVTENVSVMRRVAYSPWFIGPRTTATPQRMTSGGHVGLQLAGVPVRFETPPDPGPRPGNLVLSADTQRRPPRP